MSTILFVSLSTICYAQQQMLIVPDGHSSSISSNIKSDLQGKYIYTAETNRCIMWETKTGKQLYSFMLDNAAYGDGYIAIDISPDGSKIAIASGGFSFLYNTKTGKKVAENSRNYSYYDLKFSADGNSIYAINNGIHILDATTFTEKELIKDDLAGYGARIWLLADDKVLAGGTDILGTRFKIYDIKIKQKVSSFDMPASMKYWQFLPGSNLVSFYNYDIGTGILLYDIYTGAKKGTIPFNGDVSQARIIPSQNSNEILISAVTGLKDNTKNSSLNLYNTTTFQKTDFFKDVNFNYKDGYFDGAKKKIWIMTDTKEVAEYDFTLKKYDLNGESVADLLTVKKIFRQNLDMSILAGVIIYVLNIVDANVDAHLYGFDVNEKLEIGRAHV